MNDSYSPSKSYSVKAASARLRRAFCSAVMALLVALRPVGASSGVPLESLSKPDRPLRLRDAGGALVRGLSP